MDSLAVSALGALIVICLGVVINLLREMNKTLADHGKTVVVLHTILVGANGSLGLIDRVQSLHDWRTELQERELRRAADEIVELRRRAGDRP